MKEIVDRRLTSSAPPPDSSSPSPTAAPPPHRRARQAEMRQALATSCPSITGPANRLHPPGKQPDLDLYVARQARAFAAPPSKPPASGYRRHPHHGRHQRRSRHPPFPNPPATGDARTRHQDRRSRLPGPVRQPPFRPDACRLTAAISRIHHRRHHLLPRRRRSPRAAADVYTRHAEEISRTANRNPLRGADHGFLERVEKGCGMKSRLPRVTRHVPDAGHHHLRRKRNRHKDSPPASSSSAPISPSHCSAISSRQGPHPCFIVIILPPSRHIDLAMNAYAHEVHHNLGIFILIVVNCIIPARRGRPASGTPCSPSPMPSAWRRLHLHHLRRRPHPGTRGNGADRLERHRLEMGLPPAYQPTPAHDPRPGEFIPRLPARPHEPHRVRNRAERTRPRLSAVNSIAPLHHLQAPARHTPQPLIVANPHPRNSHAPNDLKNEKSASASPADSTPKPSPANWSISAPVICFSADLGQPDETDINTSKMAPRRPTFIIDLKRNMAACFDVLRAQAVRRRLLNSTGTPAPSPCAPPASYAKGLHRPRPRRHGTATTRCASSATPPSGPTRKVYAPWRGRPPRRIRPDRWPTSSPNASRRRRQEKYSPTPTWPDCPMRPRISKPRDPCTIVVPTMGVWPEQAE